MTDSEAMSRARSLWSLPRKSRSTSSSPSTRNPPLTVMLSSSRPSESARHSFWSYYHAALTRAHSSRLDYVEEKRKIYAPDSAPITGASKDSVPKNPYSKSAKPFNAWAERLVGEDGFPIKPSAVAAARANGKKRGAEDENEAEEREIMYDGVRFKARRTGGKDGKVEIVDEESVGKGEGGWATGKVFRFTIAKKDGSTSTDSKEDGEKFDFVSLKKRLEPIAKPAFVSLAEDRPIAPLPAGASGDKDSTMKEAAPKSEFPTRLNAPPEIKSSADVKKDDAPEASTSSASGSGAQQYPARGQASFKEVVTDETFDKLKSEVGEIDGRKVEWVRVSGAFLCALFLWSFSRDRC